VAAVFGAAFSFHQSFFYQVVDEDHHAAGQHAEPFRQRLLILRRTRGDQTQYSGVRGSNAQPIDPLSKTISRVGTELSEEKGRAGRPLFAGTHKLAGSLKKLLAKVNRSCDERFMETINTFKNGHRGPHPGIVAIAYTLLFNAGLYQVVTFTGGPHFPGPWESSHTIAAYFQGHPTATLICAFLQFGAAIPLGIFSATMVSRLQFLGVRTAGPSIAFFGGSMTAVNMALSALVLWVMVYPGIAQDTAVLRALYYLVFAIGGVGFSVPMGILIAGLSVPAAIMKLLPKWLVVFGLVLTVIGELSALSLVVPQLLFLIPLTRFPGFIWLIAAGFALPKTIASRTPATSE
jgi:hypothetical protein